MFESVHGTSRNVRGVVSRVHICHCYDVTWVVTRQLASCNQLLYLRGTLPGPINFANFRSTFHAFWMVLANPLAGSLAGLGVDEHWGMLVSIGPFSSILVEF